HREIEKLNENLAENVRTLDKKVEEKTRDIKSMLINIKQGIFTIHEHETRKGVIDPDFSDFLTEIMETRDLAGRPFMDAVFENTNMTNDQKSLIDSIISTSLDNDVLNYHINASDLPSEIEKTFENNRKKILEIDWSPVVDTVNLEKVQKILVTLRDVTTLRDLQAKNAAQKEELVYISELINLPGDKFARFVQMAKSFFEENRRLIEKSSGRDQETLKILFINMHTLKGTSRSYGLVRMTAIIHEAEQYYVLLRKDENEQWSRERLLGDLNMVEEVMNKYLDVNMKKLGRLMTREKIYLDRNVIEGKIKELTALDSLVLPDGARRVIKNTKVDLAKIIYKGSEDLFKEIFDSIGTLARDLGKEKPEVEIHSQDFNISDAGEELLRNIFIHMIRNSMDHGIEPPEERTSGGKNPIGKIVVNVERLDGKVVIIFKDDGRGINVDKLREIAETKNLLPKESLSNDLEVANTIFIDGISTSMSVTEISGRGVGMGAIKAYLEKNGGSIELGLDRSEKKDPGFAALCFRIDIPDSLFRNFSLAA
ncbi:MAG: Hpt domain-containing protein, partial [Oligoflexales bacterium]|nr:Hpt domain-containing protein [Oligoflexales bacterium]